MADQNGLFDANQGDVCLRSKGCLPDIAPVLPANNSDFDPSLSSDEGFLDLLARSDRQVFVDGALSRCGGKIRTKVFLDTTQHA